MFPEPIIFAPIHRCFSVSRYGNRSHEMSTGTRAICSQTPLENKSRVTNWQETSLSFCSDTSFGIEFSSMIRRSKIAMVIEFNTSGTISTICASDAEPSSNGIKKALPIVATCLGIRLRPNAPVHRAAANDYPFEFRATRGSVCNGLFACTGNTVFFRADIYTGKPSLPAKSDRNCKEHQKGQPDQQTTLRYFWKLDVRQNAQGAQPTECPDRKHC